jgi:hypothetical protein
MTQYPWRKYQPHNDPEGTTSERINEQMMREGSQALFVAVVKAQAEREGPDAVREFNQIVREYQSIVRGEE